MRISLTRKSAPAPVSPSGMSVTCSTTRSKTSPMNSPETESCHEPGCSARTPKQGGLPAGPASAPARAWASAVGFADGSRLEACPTFLPESDRRRCCMSSDPTQNAGDQTAARLTALLLGELPEEDAVALRRVPEQDTRLAAL